jgi:hypothetical protein
MRSWRPLSGLLLLAVVSGGCHEAAPVRAAAQPIAPRAPAPSTPPVTEAPTPTPPPNPSCPEGYKPSTQFTRKPWLDTYEAVKKLTNIWVDGDDPATAEEAQDGLCLQSSGIVGMPPNLKSTCKGDYWVISTDHLYYTDHTWVVVPRGPEAVLFDAGLIGGGLCTGEQSSTLSSLDVELHGEALRVRLRSENNEWSPDSASGGVCERSHTDVADYTYDLKTNLGCEAFHVE